jgi:hypothetical protein
VIDLADYSLRRVAKQYVSDWITYGTPAAVVRLNRRFTPELVRTIKDEFRKQGIQW